MIREGNQLLATARINYANDRTSLVIRSHGQTSTVRADRDGLNGRRHDEAGKRLLTRRIRPNRDSTFCFRDNNLAPVRAHSDRSDGLFRRDGLDQLTIGGIPNLEGLVI